jgi:hypothetical protein
VFSVASVIWYPAFLFQANRKPQSTGKKTEGIEREQSAVLVGRREKREASM